jgi:hypothetical protein
MSSSLMYKPSQEPLGGAIDEEEEEEDHERANGEDEPRDGSGGERTVETRGPVAMARRADDCGALKEHGHATSPKFARRSPKKLRRREEFARARERRFGRGDEVGRMAASVPPPGHL